MRKLGGYSSKSAAVEGESSRTRRGLILRRDWDFGAVDLGLLKRRIYAKDPSFDSQSFEGATAHLSNMEPGGAANVSQPIRSGTNTTSSEVGSPR